MDSTLPELNLWSVAGEILFVLALLLALLWVLKRYVQQQHNGKLIKTLDIMMLSPRQKIALVQAGDKVVMIGISANHMQALGEWPRTEFPNLVDTEASTSDSKFKALMNRWEQPKS